MADKTKRKSITSIDDLTEVIDFLYTIYKSIITNKLPKVHRKVKVYPSLSIPAYQRRVKVYEPLNLPDEQERVKVVTVPDNYYPTSQTEVKHVLNHERYNRIYDIIVNQLHQNIKDNASYVELNNFEELFAALEHSAITDLYEKHFDIDNDMAMVVAIYDDVMELSKQIAQEYRIIKAFGYE